MIKVYPLPLGNYQTNCYILSKDNKAVVVDPGAEVNKLITYLNSNQLELVAIVITHGHFDHIGAVEPLTKAYNVPVIIHQQEEDYLTNTEINSSGRLGRTGLVVTVHSKIETIQTEGEITLLDEQFYIYHIPGHSRGSIVLYNAESGFAIVGDVLFKSSVGRTDLIHGNHDLLIKGIKEKLMTLPDDTIVYPGHGPATLIGMEKRTNPFL